MVGPQVLPVPEARKLAFHVTQGPNKKVLEWFSHVVYGTVAGVHSITLYLISFGVGIYKRTFRHANGNDTAD